MDVLDEPFSLQLLPVPVQITQEELINVTHKQRHTRLKNNHLIQLGYNTLVYDDDWQTDAQKVVEQTFHKCLISAHKNWYYQYNQCHSCLWRW